MQSALVLCRKWHHLPVVDKLLFAISDFERELLTHAMHEVSEAEYLESNMRTQDGLEAEAAVR